MSQPFAGIVGGYKCGLNPDPLRLISNLDELQKVSRKKILSDSAMTQLQVSCKEFKLLVHVQSKTKSFHLGSYFGLSSGSMYTNTPVQSAQPPSLSQCYSDDFQSIRVSSSVLCSDEAACLFTLLIYFHQKA